MRMKRLFAVFFSFCIQIGVSICPSGCRCEDSDRQVECEGVGSVPIFLNPILRTLSLSNSTLRLDRDAIRLYGELERLELVSVELRDIPEALFDSLPNLRHLRLSGNRFRRIDSAFFDGLSRLESLDLSGNDIDELSADAFDELVSLESLNLNSNRLAVLESNPFKSLNSLRRLDLSRNGLRSAALPSLSSLQSLNLSHNSLSSIEEKAFGQMRSLEQLDLSENRISQIRRSNSFSSVRFLDLSGNSIRDLADVEWESFPAAESLDLSENGIEIIGGGGFVGLSALRSLQLNEMKSLTELRENAFDSLYRLESLSVSKCPQLVRIHSNAFGDNFALRSLDLSSNHLRTIEKRTLKWERLEWMDVSGNPLLCDCGLLEFLPPIVGKLGNTRAFCAEPTQMAGIALQLANRSKCSVIGDYGYVPLGVGALLAIFTLLVLLVFCVKSRCCHEKSSTSMPKQNGGRLPLYTASASLSDSSFCDKTLRPSMETAHYAVAPGFRPLQRDNGEYYSSIVLLPPGCHRCSPSPYATSTATTNSSSMGNIGRTIEANPYAIGRMRAPSFVAPPPPPPPTMPPPPRLLYRQIESPVPL